MAKAKDSGAPRIDIGIGEADRAAKSRGHSRLVIDT
jgi:hypothetical protein